MEGFNRVYSAIYCLSQNAKVKNIEIGPPLSKLSKNKSGVDFHGPHAA